MRIKQLSSLLASQIAAGEVVERPASVLKELVENSLDANSSKINIAIESGGVKLIQIRDNGSGIYQDDLILAFSQHATSKIEAVQDLACINSLGFRGEALASIAGVGKVTINSKPENQAESWQIFNKDLLVTKSAHPDGTTIQVRDLFYNVPARRKFLRSERTEYIHLEEVFKKIALSHLDVSFTWTNNSKQIYDLPSCKTDNLREMRFAKICGERMLNNSIYIDIEQNGLRLWGWLGLPTDARATAELQFFYVNKRIVRDRLINHAIRQGYKDYLPTGRYATYCLYLELDPASIDVNVHPTKHEIRFRDSRVVHAFLSTAIDKGLKDGGGVENIVTETMTSSEILPILEAKQNSFSNNSTEISGYNKNTCVDFNYSDANQRTAFTENIEVSKSENVNIVAMLDDNKFILAEYNSKLVILNIIKAKVRCFLSELASDNNIIRIKLLMPQPITCEINIIESIIFNMETFKTFGFIIEEVGPQQLLIKEVPKILQGCDFAYKNLFSEISEFLKKLKSIKFFCDKNNIDAVMSLFCKNIFCDKILSEQEILDLTAKSLPFVKAFDLEELTDFISG